MDPGRVLERRDGRPNMGGGGGAGWGGVRGWGGAGGGEVVLGAKKARVWAFWLSSAHTVTQVMATPPIQVVRKSSPIAVPKNGAAALERGAAKLMGEGKRGGGRRGKEGREGKVEVTACNPPSPPPPPKKQNKKQINLTLKPVLNWANVCSRT